MREPRSLCHRALVVTGYVTCDFVELITRSPEDARMEAVTCISKLQGHKWQSALSDRRRRICRHGQELHFNPKAR